MIDIRSEADIQDLAESFEVEVKRATGRDGRGTLPKDFWPTYSAFANTNGGYVILGVEELPDEKFRVIGIAQPNKVIHEITSALNNTGKVSANILGNEHFETISVEGKDIVLVRVPRATRHARPVYVGGNPMTGTFRRFHSGDQKCDGATVKRWLTEQKEDSRDGRILSGFGINDLDDTSIRTYRQMLSDRSPSHPFLDETGIDFLRKIQAYGKNRETGEEGLTVAGLLMFGEYQSIQEEFPNYQLDYQQRPNAKTELRWIDRVTLDGSWSGNLFDFFRRVFRKLTEGLKVPFELSGPQSRGETGLHEAIREALANCIVHADYTLPASVLVVRRPDMFGFRNPGLMRVPIEQALKGGESDGRNRIIQSMFLLVGLGEKAGSGLPKIRKGWQEQHWTPPNLYERETPSEQTLLELRMIDLISPEVIDCLVAEFGDRFSDLGHDERIIVATAHVEGVVNHSRAMSLVDQHPSDLTKTFRALIHEGFLRQIGSRRGTSYVLPNSDLPTPDEGEFGFQPNSAKPSDLGGKPSDLGGKPSDLEDKPLDLGAERSKVAIESSTVHGAPLVKSPRDLTPEVLASLQEISLPVRETGKCPAEVMERVICAMCEGRYITLGALSEFLNRSSDYLRPGPLKNLIKARKLSMAYPQMPNHPGQAYTSTHSPSLAES